MLRHKRAQAPSVSTTVDYEVLLTTGNATTWSGAGDGLASILSLLIDTDAFSEALRQHATGESPPHQSGILL